MVSLQVDVIVSTPKLSCGARKNVVHEIQDRRSIAAYRINCMNFNVLFSRKAYFLSVRIPCHLPINKAYFAGFFIEHYVVVPHVSVQYN